MRLLVLVKPVPDVENFRYDYERNVLVRENVHLVINPEDATALATALSIKAEVPETSIETVSMAPQSAMPHLEDLVRRGVDRATLISDPRYVGSDTYVTSRILARYIQEREYDCILSGTHTLDGGTSHVPAQLAEVLGIPQMSNIVDMENGGLSRGTAVVDVDTESALLRFSIQLPAVLSFQYVTARKLPYIPYEMMDADVSNRIVTISNDDLGFEQGEVGIGGSLTKVASVEVKRLHRKDTVFLRPDEEGIDRVYRFLREKGFVPS